MNLQEAIDAPAWHIEHFPLSFWPRTARPGVLVVESRLPKATIKELERRGHKVEVGPGLVGGPAERRLAGRRAPQGRRQRARHAGLCRGAVKGLGREKLKAKIKSLHFACSSVSSGTRNAGCAGDG